MPGQLTYYLQPLIGVVDILLGAESHNAFKAVRPPLAPCARSQYSGRRGLRRCPVVGWRIGWIESQEVSYNPRHTGLTMNTQSLVTWWTTPVIHPGPQRARRKRAFCFFSPMCGRMKVCVKEAF